MSERAPGADPATVTPEELLAAADWLLTATVPGVGTQWPRACAVLIRLALEMTLDRFWAGTLPAAASVGMRQQLILLPLYTGDWPAAAGLAREAWLGLAAAAHHHAYELAPTAGELRTWYTKVGELAGLLARGLAGRGRHRAVRGAHDLAGFTDGGVSDLRVGAHQSLLGRVQTLGDIRVAPDFHDDGPLAVECADRDRTVFFFGAGEFYFYL